MLLHIKSTIIAGPAYQTWWHLHLSTVDREKWNRYGAAYLTTKIVDNSTNNRLIVPIESFVLPDELEALIDPERGVTRVFADVRAARDYEDRIKRHVTSGLTEYWMQATGFAGEIWYPKRP
jgi:hypothetical protein